MVEVLFHVGAHKCATSSLQRGLSALTKGDPRVLYIGPKDQEPAVAALCVLAAGRKRAETSGTAQQIADKLVGLIAMNADKDRVIISNENIIGSMPGVRWSFYPRAEAARAVIDRVAERFPTQIFLQSRETSSFVRSCYQHRVQRGLAMSYAHFLEKFNLLSISWMSLGATLFGGAQFRARVLPIEFLKGGNHAYARESVKFVLPKWDLGQTHLTEANTARSPLMRSSISVLSRAGRILTPKKRKALYEALAFVEATLSTTQNGKAHTVVQEAFKTADLSLSEELSRIILVQYREEAQAGGTLHDILYNHFARDYSAFCLKYTGLPASVRKPKKSSLKGRFR